MRYQRNNRKSTSSSISAARGRPRQVETGYRCLQCRHYVSCDPLVAGVQNRNHCPYCLWSRHVDWQTAGDRLASCRAPMQPLGLTLKRSRNKYASDRDGELMLIHRCTGCGRLSINRIAADDSAAALFEIFEGSWSSGAAPLAEIAQAGIEALAAQDSALVRLRLLGR